MEAWGSCRAIEWVKIKPTFALSLTSLDGFQAPPRCVTFWQLDAHNAIDVIWAFMHTCKSTLKAGWAQCGHVDTLSETYFMKNTASTLPPHRQPPTPPPISIIAPNLRSCVRVKQNLLEEDKPSVVMLLHLLEIQFVLTILHHEPHLIRSLLQTKRWVTGAIHQTRGVAAEMLLTQKTLKIWQARGKKTREISKSKSPFQGRPELKSKTLENGQPVFWV